MLHKLAAYIDFKIYFVGFFEQQQQVSLLPVLQQQFSHLQSAPHLTVAHLQSKYIIIDREFSIYTKLALETDFP